MRLRSSTGDTGHFNINEPAKYKKSQLWKVVRSASLIFIIASIAIYYYYTTFIKISGIAIISANKITLTSPGQAIVEDMLNLNDFEDVKEGQKIAQLGIHVSDIIGLNRDMYNFQEKILFFEEKNGNPRRLYKSGRLNFQTKTSRLRASNKCYKA